MTIRQVSQYEGKKSGPQAANPGGLAVHVRTGHLLIGNTWYAPEVSLTNSFASAIRVTKVELAAGGTSYSDQLHRYPEVASGQTVPLETWFDLRKDIWKTFFKRPADLKIFYERDGQEEIAHATILGDHLNAAAP